MSGLGKPRDYDHGIYVTIKELIFDYGRHINGSSQRIYLTMYPILIFLIGYSSTRINILGKKLGDSFLPKLIIVGNLVLLLTIFAFPRVKIISAHPHIDHKASLVSEQWMDVYNLYQSSNELAYIVKEKLPGNAIVYFSKNDILGAFSVKNILFPIKGIFIEKPFLQNTTQFQGTEVYFAGFKNSFPKEFFSSKNRVIYKDSKWQVIKLSDI